MNKFMKFSCIIITLFLATTQLSQCTSDKKQKEENTDYKGHISSTLWEINKIDSLETLLQHFIEQNDDIGKMLCYKRIGVYLRDNARFSEAINNHKESLKIATKLKDTLEIVQSMNNLGTVFRRIGAQSEASQYHYQALNHIEVWSKMHTPIGIKNRNMSLNGIGNISLTLGFYDDAKSRFHEALKHEIELDDPVGQAINYANLGAIFEIKQHYDSAYLYYNKSLELNKKAKSNKGIGICQIHLGELYEKEGRYELAKTEYKKLTI